MPPCRLVRRSAAGSPPCFPGCGRQLLRRRPTGSPCRSPTSRAWTRPSCRRPRWSSRELTDEGLAGATRIADNQTTGGFLGHDYTLSERIVPADGDMVAAFKERLAAGERLFVADLHAEDLLAIAVWPRPRAR